MAPRKIVKSSVLSQEAFVSCERKGGFFNTSYQKVLTKHENNHIFTDHFNVSMIAQQEYQGFLLSNHRHNGVSKSSF